MKQSVNADHSVSVEWRVTPQNEPMNLGVKTVYLVISHPIEEAW